MPTPSQATIVGQPQPSTWDDLEKGCHATFGGGYRTEVEREIFRHGMTTVFNLLRAEFPPAETCKASPELLAACQTARSLLIGCFQRMDSVEREAYESHLMRQIQDAITKSAGTQFVGEATANSPKSAIPAAPDLRDMLACVDCGGFFKIDSMLPSSPSDEADPICHRCADLLMRKSAIPSEAICLFKDGDKWCCTNGDFVNLQESPAGFGDTFDAAIVDLQAVLAATRA